MQIIPYSPELFEQFFVLFRAFSDRKPEPKEVKEAIEKSASTDRIFCAMSERSVVGFIILKIGWDVESFGIISEIRDLYVDPNHRGRGIGRELIARAVEESEKSGAKFIKLMTMPDALPAHALYEAAGFKLGHSIQYWKGIK